jgi:two-component system, chemotaxis family, sensor kinase CheA
MSGLDELRISFFQECEDLLDSLGEGLRAMSDLAAAGTSDGDIETVHAVFRAVHSIKGGAGAFGLDDLVTFAHLFETVLDEMRGGKMGIAVESMHVLLRAGDMLSDLVACARDGVTPDPERMGQLLAELDALADGAGGGDHEVPFEFVPTVVSVDPIAAVDTSKGAPGAAPETEQSVSNYRIRFAPRGELYGTGNEPLALFRALQQLGELTVSCDADVVPPLSDFDPSEPRLRWKLTLVSEATLEEIAAVFEFVADVAELGVETLPAFGEAPDTDVAPQERTNAESDTLPGRETPSSGGGTPAVDSDGPHAREATPEFTGDEPPASQPEPAQSAGPGSPSPTPSSAAAPATIRVNLDRVDRLINLIGELVIMEAMLSQAIESAGLASDSDVSNGLDGIKQLASGIQESVMAIRAQPLKPVFQRMHRIIREAADATGKQVRLVTTGETTEVDKTVIERLVDPLTHMIRNSVDHGLEDAADRTASGKPETGTITLSAAHRSGRVIIEVSDDGAGINREKVRRIAEDKGLVATGAALTAGEIDNLLFTPGFSSKDEVSALSGRGVGLDVVRREIQALGGRVTIQSSAGEGTTFTIALPLTLAVLEGMLVEFGGEMMVLPLSAILETLRPSSATIHAIGRTGRVVANRGELIPIIDLAEAFGVADPGGPEERDVLLLVECEAGRRAALAVDVIHDQRQVVIKSLEENYGVIPGISAATILGDGRIALIVDPEEIIASAGLDTATPQLAANE